MKKLLFPHFSVNKGLIQHVVQSCYNYNLSFRKLEIHTVKMRPISACYTSGRGNSLNRALFGLRPLHYTRIAFFCFQQVNIKINIRFKHTVLFVLFLNIAMIKSLKMSTFVFGAR